MRFHGNVILFALVVMPLLLVQVPARADAQERRQGAVLAWVDGEAVTMDDLEIILANAAASPADAALVGDFSPASVLRRLIQNRLLEQEGYRIGAQEKPEVKNQVLDFVQYRSMVALLDSIQAEVPDPDPGDIDSLLNRTHTMRRLSHILVDSEALARDLLDSLNAGTPFADLAERRSRDTTWAGEGGDLGWAGEGRFIPEFERELPGMAVGDVAGPVATENGWHLIHLAEIRMETAGQSDPMKEAIHDARKEERVMKVMEDYLSLLKKKHGVVVNEPLLTSLDYASSDPSIQAELKTSQAVLARMPGRDLTVKGLSFKIRFKHFHGIAGKENADQIRDEMFHDWLAESLFRHEAKVQGYQNRADIVAAADRLERRLVREGVLESIVGFAYEPAPEEVDAYYRENLDEFTRAARIKVEGVLIEEEKAAREFRAKLDQGATVKWLVGRSPEIKDPDPLALRDWLDPGVLGFSEDVKRGAIAGPVMVDGHWAVASVVKVGSRKPIPLETCRSLVIKKIRSKKRHEAVSRSLEILESEARIEVEGSAHGMIEKRIDAWRGGQS